MSREGVVTISYGDCTGKGAPKVIDPEKLLNVMESGLTRRPNSKVLQRESFKFQGYPGRHVIMQEPDVFMDTFAIVRDRRVYFLIAMSKDESWLTKPAVRHFFASFRLEPQR